MSLFNVKISSRAQSDRVECIMFLFNINVNSAIELNNEMQKQIKSLEQFPERNPIFDMPKSFPFLVRKLLINKRYIALYTIEGNDVIVYRILDSRRKFNSLLY